MGRNTGILERRFVPRNSIIVKQGEEGYSAYLIQSGSVSVFTSDGDQEIELAQLSVGQIFGEMALAFDERRTASVRTIDDCNLIVITREALRQKLERSDPTVRAIVSMLTQRVVSANNAVLNKKENVNDLKDTTNIIYENIMATLSEKKAKDFEDMVRPKLTEFITAIEAFQEKHGKT